jgi:hypothetical protein
MATTTFGVRQFFNIASELLPLAQPTGTYIVTGSISNLLVNNNRTNLAEDVIPGVGSSGTGDGWWPGADTANLYGIIVGGNDTYANPSPDGRTSTVSVWGWDAQEDQPSNDVEFRRLAGTILGATYADTASAKTALRNAGFYYQYPVGFDGQSPNTGTGSDV